MKRFFFLIMLVGASMVFSQDYWQQTGIPARQDFNSIAVTPSGTLFVTTSVGVVFRSTDNGSTWTQIVSGIAEDSVTSLSVHPNGTIYVVKDHKVFYSTNGGDSWTGTGYGYYYLNSIAVDRTGEVFVGFSGAQTYFRLSGYVGPAARVDRSTDGGSNWEKVLDGDLNQPTGFSIVYSLNSVTDNISYVCTNHGIFQSSDAGKNWTPQTNVLANSSNWAFTANPNGIIFAGGSIGVYYSTDSGTNWTAAGLTNVAVSSITCNSGGNIFAGTNTGIYRSRDDGSTWIARNSGLANTDIRALTINSRGYLFAVTAGGVFRSSITTNGVKDNALPRTSFELSQNYPNPFNPSTVIGYSISAESKVTLKVFNTLGREVTTLVNAEKPAGNYEVKFDAANIPGGIYFYELKAGKFSSTRKLILVK